MNSRINNYVPPLKNKNPIFLEQVDIKARWTYETKDTIIFIN